MSHPDADVQSALTRLLDTLCSWERSTGRRSVLILREQGGFTCRAGSGKPVFDDSIPDSLLYDVEIGEVPS